MAESQVINLILHGFKDHMTKYMQSNIPDDDPTRADVVKVGLLLADKTKKNIQIGITGGDHEKPDLEDGIRTLEKQPEIGIQYAAREIGGGEVWIRRGVIRVEIFFIKEGFLEEKATEIAYNVLGRALTVAGGAPLSSLTDTFGEKVITHHIYGNTFFQSGGPKSWIFRGKIFWLAYTERY